VTGSASASAEISTPGQTRPVTGSGLLQRWLISNATQAVSGHAVMAAAKEAIDADGGQVSGALARSVRGGVA
jgi:hypothetical protein